MRKSEKPEKAGSKSLKEDILNAVKSLFSEYEKNCTSYEKVQWELDYERQKL